MIGFTIRNGVLLCCILTATTNAQLHKASDYFPLQVGNIWEYDATFKQPRYEVVGDTTIEDGSRYYKTLVTSPNDPGTHSMIYYHYNDDSTKVYQVGDQFGINEWLFMDSNKDIKEPWFAFEDTTFSASMLAISDTGRSDFLRINWETITIGHVVFVNDSLFYLDGYVSYAKGLGEIESDGEKWLVYALVNGVEYGTPLSVEAGPGPNEIPQEFQLNVYPNPFKGYATFHVEIRKRESLQIKVFNLLGQSVRNLFDGKLSVGNHFYLWDGKNDLGRDLARGVYFIRLQTPNTMMSRTITLIR